MRQVY